MNSAPLIWSFAHGSRRRAVNLIDAVPAQCAELLANRQVEAALVPVIEYQRLPEVELVPDVCVGSKGKVRSVVLVSTTDDLKQVRTVGLDETSRTSATLIKIVFREFLGFEPQWTSSAPDLTRMLNENDAALIIGDPAMTFPRDERCIFDMASLWREYTGLGFVFAMWMTRANASAAARKIDFTAACDEGLAATEEIIDLSQVSLALPRNELRAYLRENITFYLDSDLRAGLDLYYELAGKHGLISRVKPLQWITAER